jgi:L,D-peptidoglycan transpeptidase YkuD (ErfK/YbiS/YcfS/YnhG family)
MDIEVWPGADGTFRLAYAGFTMRCAIGRGGFKTGKQEGDGGTPVGRFPLREAFYRPDRLLRPATGLPMRALSPDDGWCDAPDAPEYNRLVTLPFGPSHETLWREDSLYDVVVVIGYNDAPPVAGRGSAIFLHVCRSDYAPTEGCVACPLEELLKLLALVQAGTGIAIRDHS